MTSRWTGAQVAAIAAGAVSYAPSIALADVRPVIAGVDLWDHWPVQDTDGRAVRIAGGELFFFLSAPAAKDPEARHAQARIRLLHRRGDRWTDLGSAMPDGWSPGSREWAGSAVLSPQGQELTLYFTATGRRGEATPSFDQRLIEARATLGISGNTVRLERWSVPVESVRNDGRIYTSDMTGGGAIGTIKAFRDPAYFRDPLDGSEHLLFAASLANSDSPWNGAVGHAARVENGAWELQPPLIVADGLNNELERPHVIVHDRLYYLFWSTQAKVFAPDGPVGPTGLYGMVAPRLRGPYRPLNGTGLVFANPVMAPAQAYSWLVLSDLRVLSFADLVGLGHAPRSVREARAHFGGSPAPMLRLTLEGPHALLL